MWWGMFEQKSGQPQTPASYGTEQLRSLLRAKFLSCRMRGLDGLILKVPPSFVIRPLPGFSTESQAGMPLPAQWPRAALAIHHPIPPSSLPWTEDPVSPHGTQETSGISADCEEAFLWGPIFYNPIGRSHFPFIWWPQWHCWTGFQEFGLNLLR